MAVFNRFLSFIIAPFVGLLIFMSTNPCYALSNLNISTATAQSPIPHTALDITSIVQPNIINKMLRMPMSQAAVDVSSATQPHVLNGTPSPATIQRRIKRFDKMIIGTMCSILTAAALVSSLFAVRDHYRKKRLARWLRQVRLHQLANEVRDAISSWFLAQKDRASGRARSFPQRQGPRAPLRIRNPMLRHLLSSKRRTQGHDPSTDILDCEKGKSSRDEPERSRPGESAKSSSKESGHLNPDRDPLSPVLRREAVKTV